MFNAVYAPLMGRPISDQGRAVVTRLHEAITAHERAINPRKYSRGKTRAQFDKAIGAFAADLLLAQTHKKAEGWIQRSLRPGRSTMVRSLGHRAAPSWMVSLRSD